MDAHTGNPDRSPQVSRRHDQSYKLLFALPLAIENLIRGFIDGDLADELDFDRMESLATERTTPGLIRSQADLLWKVHFRGSARFLLLPIEFQSAIDRYMSVRTLYYVAIGYHSLISSKEPRRKLAPGGLLPPTLAVTIYNGRVPWTAPDDVFDMIEPVRGWLAGRQARLEHVKLREAFRDWVLGAAESWGIGEETLDRVKSLKEAGMIYAGVEELKERARRKGLGEGRAEGHIRGNAEGRRQGRATLICQQARLKFGAETADRLSRLLEDITDPEQIARIGCRIIECETGAELLAQARET